MATGTGLAHTACVTRMTVTGILLLSLLMVAPSAHAGPIINGGFETGGFDGWSTDLASAGSLLFVGGHSHSGADAAWFGALGNGDDSLSQTFGTLAGGSYTVSFWLSHGATNTANDFSVWWDATPLLRLNKAAKFRHRQYTFTVTADDDLTTLRFYGRERVDYYYLDDVSVTYLTAALGAPIPTPTPEPATITLLLGGLVALAGRSRVSRKKPLL